MLSAEDRAQLLARYRTGYQAVVDALQGITEAELDTSMDEDGWTPRQVVHHLPDSEMTAAVRLRRLIAEDHPAIVGYDENEFARRLHYERPIAVSLELLRWVRESNAELLERLSEDDWAREGTHSEMGAYSVQGWLAIYASHPHDHAAQIRRARGLDTTKGD